MMAQGSTIDSQPCCRAWFDALDPVLPAEMIGLWRGVGIPSGHPLDGVLENLQWFGKRFHADLSADALLFQWKPGRLVPLDPALIPIRMTILFAPFGRTFVARNWLSYMQKVFRARGTTASFKLRMIDGGETAAMVYDRRPIVDYFRWIKDDELAGMMVVEGDERRYFFRLQRVDVPTRNGSS
ncbi:MULTISPECIES: GXWXG domain-containing protein [unclassified Rhizobium]|uniref:GXWXG domain-containing protein n=1 Tax=unclassified Rhizobium TaxID=2613769 RepID=UPI0007EAFB90|nr:MULTISPECIES: GXWXG domain-containing protein [unclassified Rhizobium]ANM13156.1 hypothetical protein AMK05_PB00018 [Rhizobium sp. N324]ANM19554.1 hypothetical protein AMK06_PB00018 [Rhizobium sp. N541]ANM25939.1 hypothetical protein AMK07_PB00018 [Rhizobium sp. N941]OYD00949.1 hypothetical protein AMK08_PB00019 [Rhizobium sp. N4311]